MYLSSGLTYETKLTLKEKRTGLEIPNKRAINNRCEWLYDFVTNKS